MDDPKIVSAWIAAAVAIIGVCVTIISQSVFRYWDGCAKRQHEILGHRRTALVKALKVLDHVYSNLRIGGLPPANPHLWDISDAHDAMNGMIIFCENPSAAVTAFNAALGVSAETFHPMENLVKFRHVVCDELGLARTNYNDANVVWISGLPGTSQQSISAAAAEPPAPQPSS